MLDRIRNFPEGATAEDQMRELMKVDYDVTAVPVTTDGSWGAYKSAQDAIDYLYNIMEKDGPFDGIIGYSEGATVAATLLLHEQRRFETEGIPAMFKCALFFAGWPPMNPDLNSIVLADESDLTITIPTCHVSKYFAPHHRSSQLTREVGSLDPYLAGSIALYNICDVDTAILFDHGKGHTLPRDKGTVKELGNIVRDMIAGLEDSEESYDS